MSTILCRCMTSTLIVMLLVCGLATVSASEQPGWLNAKDLGTSGSLVETNSVATAGSREITVQDPADFQAGQEVIVSGCHPHYTYCHLRPPENPFSNNPLGDAAEMRGYDGSSGSWLVYLLEIDGVEPATFRWTDDMARTWKGTKTPITFDWQPLSSGLEIKLAKRAWQSGEIIDFSARDQLFTKIEKIKGNVFTLQDPATRDFKEAVVRHCDTQALQEAISRALKEKRRLYIPPGHYRLAGSLNVSDPNGIVIEGADGVNAILDISEGRGACLKLISGTEATVRNLRLVGHTGLGEGPGWRSFRTSSGRACWPVGMKPCQAITIRNTERVLIENCHASRMNCEAFYCQGSSRSGLNEPKAYTRLLTYLRCSVTNCDGNAFNNNDLAENTSVLYCRIQDVGGCTWEGASRFVRFIGNYVRHSGTIAMGNIGSRAEHLEQLGSGQHIVADNVFEGDMFYAGRSGGYMIRAAHGATQVIIRNNLFVNFASSGIEVTGMADDRHLPTNTATISGNIMDLTNLGENKVVRTGINVSASGVIVSNNQVYVRGDCDPDVTGILVKEPAVNLLVHDNLIRSCGRGLATDRVESIVVEVVDPRTFLCASGRGIPFERRQSHRYRGWNVAWLDGAQAKASSVLEGFDPESLQFSLREPYTMKVGDRLAIYPPLANWSLHDNTITGCLEPVVLDSYGSSTSFLTENLVSRGETTGVKQAIAVRGRFSLKENHVQGFDEPDSAALGLYPDQFGEPVRNVYRRNTFDGCSRMFVESEKALWEAADTGENSIITRN